MSEQVSEQVIAINRLSRITLWIVASLAILSAVGWWLSTRAPSTWLDPNTLAADPESDRRGRELEQNLASAIARVRPAGEPWAIRIHDIDINSWIARRLPQWTEHDPTLAWPIEGAKAQVHFDEQWATISIALKDRIWSGSFTAQVEAGQIRLVPGWGAIGLLPVPAGTQFATDLLEGNGAKTLVLPKIFKLGDGRQVEIRRIDLVPGAVEIEFATR